MVRLISAVVAALAAFALAGCTQAGGWLFTGQTVPATVQGAAKATLDRGYSHSKSTDASPGQGSLIGSGNTNVSGTYGGIFMNANSNSVGSTSVVLDVAPVCHGIASQSGLEPGLTATNFDQCVKGEQDTREALIKEWSNFNSDDKTHCIAETTMGGESSYTELVTCLEMARDVRKLHSDPDSSRAPIQQIPPAPVGHSQPTSQ
jgi:hypothetical protein